MTVHKQADANQSTSVAFGGSQSQTGSGMLPLILASASLGGGGGSTVNNKNVVRSKKVSVLGKEKVERSTMTQTSYILKLKNSSFLGKSTVLQAPNNGLISGEP